MLNAIVYLGCFVAVVFVGIWRLAHKIVGF